MNREIKILRRFLPEAIILLLISVFSISGKAQLSDFPVEMPVIGNIHFDGEQFENITDNERFADLFQKFDSLLVRGNNNISIVHIGGSHIQADIYTHRIRQRLQSFYPGINGSRGFVFPYTLANTNNPANYKITYTGQWDPCFSTKGQKTARLGLSGITVALMDTFSIINIRTDYDSVNRYDFNTVRIFCSHLSENTVRVMPPASVVKSEINEELGFISFELSAFTDTLNLEVNASGLEGNFELYGLSLENGDPGVTYHAIGVNGATLTSYLKCDLMMPQLIALQPDWIILSIGTNDAYTRKFNGEAFKKNYTDLLNMITRSAPDAAIMLTVPNDSYLYRRNANPNTEVMQKLIFELAEEYSCGVWDFYKIMGGFNSSSAWFNAGLMNTDHIHFNKAGYNLKGDLFFTSFIESWSNYNSRQHNISGISFHPVKP